MVHSAYIGNTNFELQIEPEIDGHTEVELGCRLVERVGDDVLLLGSG